MNLDLIQSATDRSPAAASEGEGVLTPFHAERTRDLIGRWMTFLREQVAVGQLAETTVDVYSRGVSMWLRFLEVIARSDIPSAATITSYIAAVRPTRKPSTVNALLAALRSLYAWAESAGHYANIARSARAIRLARDQPLPALSGAEVAKLVASIDGHGLRGLRDRALVCTMFATAARCVSLERANVGDLDLAGGVLRHRPKGARATEAVARLTPVAVAALRAYLAERAPAAATEPLFEPVGNRRSAEGRLTTRSMREIVRRLMERGGHARRDVAGRLVERGTWAAHCLRRSAMTVAYESEGVTAAQMLAGHASPATTERHYVRVQKAKTLQRLTAVLDLPLDVLSGCTGGGAAIGSADGGA